MKISISGFLQFLKIWSFPIIKILACVTGPQFYGGPDLQRAGFWRARGGGGLRLKIGPPIKLRACHAGYKNTNLVEKFEPEVC